MNTNQIKFAVAYAAVNSINTAYGQLTEWAVSMLLRKKAKETKKDYTNRVKDAVVQQILAEGNADQIAEYVKDITDKDGKVTGHTLNLRPNGKSSPVITVLYREIGKKFPTKETDSEKGTKVVDDDVVKALAALAKKKGWDKATLLGFINGVAAS